MNGIPNSSWLAGRKPEARPCNPNRNPPSNLLSVLRRELLTQARLATQPGSKSWPPPANQNGHPCSRRPPKKIRGFGFPSKATKKGRTQKKANTPSYPRAPPQPAPNPPPKPFNHQPNPPPTQPPNPTPAEKKSCGLPDEPPQAAQLHPGEAPGDDGAEGEGEAKAPVLDAERGGLGGQRRAMDTWSLFLQTYPKKTTTLKEEVAK